MQVLIHKTNLVRLEPRLPKVGIGLSDPVVLLREGDANVAALVTLPSRFPFGLGKPRTVRIGYLGEQAKAMLWPALEKAAPLRVRIVGVLTAHLKGDGMNQISISVWGDPADIATERLEHLSFMDSGSSDNPTNSDEPGEEVAASQSVKDSSTT